MSDARRAFAANPVAALLATGLGSGLSPIAPGTAGSLLGLAIAWLLASHSTIFGSPLGLMMSGLAVGLLGVAVSYPVCRALESEDPGCIVIDEVAGQLVASAIVPLLALHAPMLQAAAWIASFLLFRFYDVVKPGPIGRLQGLPGGWGVVADDIAGGFAAALTLAVLGWLATRLGWT